MAVDLELIRKRVSELNGQRRTSSVQLWKPGPGEYKVRCLPWKSTPDGMPFRELRFYYLGDMPRILAPSQFGKPDPINDLIRKLFSTKDPDDREMAKKLMAKMTAYIPIVVRGEEEKNVQVWSFNKFIYSRLLGFFTDTEINPDLVDYIDPIDGFDLRVTIKPSGKKFNKKDVMDTVVDLLAVRRLPLHSNPETAKKWLDSVPNIDDMYPQKTSQEIEQALNTWLASGATGDSGNDEGSGRGAEKDKDPLAQLVDEVKAEVKPQVKAAAATAPLVSAKKSTKKAADVDIDAASTGNAKESLDAAFADLMEDADD